MPEIEFPQALGRNELMLNNEEQTAAGRLRETLFDGVAMGVKHRLSSSEDLALMAGTAFVGAGALRMAMNAGGKWGTAAKVASSLFVLGAAADVTRRAVPTVMALSDSYNSNLNMAENKATVANYLGTALVDYPLAMGAGAVGWRAGGMLRPAQSFSINLPNDRYTMNSQLKLDAPTRALIEGGVPINPTNRAAANAILEAGARPVASQNVKLASDQLLNSGVPINADTRAAAQALSGSGLKPADMAKAIKAMTNPSKLDLPPNSMGGAPQPGIPKFEFPSIKINPAKFEALTYQSVMVQSRLYPNFPVLPVDLTSGVEQVHLVKAGAAAGALGAGVMAPNAEQPRLIDRVQIVPPPPNDPPQAHIRMIEVAPKANVPPAQMHEWMHQNPEAARILRELEKKKN